MKPCIKCGKILDDEWTDNTCTSCWWAITQTALSNLLKKLGIKV